MLTLARADSGYFNVILEPVDLATVVEEACEMARPLADARGLFLTVYRGSEQSTTVLGDFPSLRRMLLVLLDNALKYTDAPGRIEVVLNTISDRRRLLWSEIAVSVLLQQICRIFSTDFIVRTRREVRSREQG